MKLQPLKWPVIKQVAGVVKGVRTVMKILGFVTGKRTQALLLVIGLLLAIGQPLIASHWPEYSDTTTKILEALGVAAGITFAEKINRLIAAVKDLLGKT